ncbi:hypothetical protein C942_02440 [Photobacterium marinum]|uniref:Uncharacterized protein n=1 Tax=Photobacterium marinum TaxID=1056511 RepID=L8JAD2_9GAMM|nr:hypothetical protein C942_02440 [Photobacterium marinum]
MLFNLTLKKKQIQGLLSVQRKTSDVNNISYHARRIAPI